MERFQEKNGNFFYFTYQPPIFLWIRQKIILRSKCAITETHPFFLLLILINSQEKNRKKAFFSTKTHPIQENTVIS
jgi:hypothetical protein